MDLEAAGNGYYILDSSGIVLEYGDVQNYGNGKLGEGYIDMEMAGNGYYLLTNRGSVEVFGDATFYGDLDSGDAISLGITPYGYYILEKNGKLHFFGNVHDYGYEILDEPSARDIEIVPELDGYYILDEHGNTYSYFAAAGFSGPEYSEESKYIDLELIN